MGDDSPPPLSPNLHFNLQIELPKRKSRSEMGLLNTLQYPRVLNSQLSREERRDVHEIVVGSIEQKATFDTQWIGRMSNLTEHHATLLSI